MPFTAPLHEPAIHVMHKEVSQNDMMNRTIVDSLEAHAVAVLPVDPTGIRQLKIVDLPILLVLQEQRLRVSPLGLYQRLRALAVRIDDDPGAFLAGTVRRQLTPESTPGLEENLVARAKDRSVDTAEGPPSVRGVGPRKNVLTFVAVNVIGDPARGRDQHWGLGASNYDANQTGEE